MRTPFLNFLLVSALAVSAAAQTAPLALSDAVAVALDKSPAKKLATADVAAASSSVSLERSAFLPRVEFAETLTRGNDPVYAFGTRLRQGRFTQSDFALNRLNFPEAIGNFSSRIGGQWNLFNSFQSRLQLRRAQSMHTAAQQQLSRADQEIVFEVVRAYLAVLLAQHRVDVAERALTTANAVVETASSKVRAGTVVEADALAAEVAQATRQQELVRARGDVQIAFAQLETTLGAPLAPGHQLVDALAERNFPTVHLDAAEALALKRRPDLQAAASQLGAQQASVKAARAAFGPRLDAFASWQADNPSFATGGNNNWMTGLELRIDLFARDKNGAVAAEKAALSRVEAMQQMATARVRLDVRRSYYDFDAAQQLLQVSRAATAQADETLRIIRDRYDSGLVTVTELLRAQDAALASRMNFWNALYSEHVSYAALQLATGELNAQSPLVTQ